MKRSMSELEEKISGALLTFVDFIYAVVFGLVVAETYDKVVLATGASVAEKTANVLLVVSVFYFLSWDWLHGRLLTLKNPYRRYRRFFIEILIAFAGYGAALEAIKMNTLLVVYVGIILTLGATWSISTLKEHPDTSDKRELETIKSYQLWIFGAGSTAFLVWDQLLELNPIVNVLTLIIAGWMFVLFYELNLKRDVGISGGPGVPFLGEEQLEKIRPYYKKLG